VSLQFLLNSLTDQVFGLMSMMYVHWTIIAAALWQTQAGNGAPLFKEEQTCCGI